MRKENESKITYQNAIDKIIESYLVQKRTWFIYQYGLLNYLQYKFSNYLPYEPDFIDLNDETKPLAYRYYQLILSERFKYCMSNYYSTFCVVPLKEEIEKYFEAIKEIEKLPEEDGVNLIKKYYGYKPVFLKNKAIMMQLMQSVKEAAENNEREIIFRGVKFGIEKFPCSDLISLVGEKSKITINTKNNDTNYEDFKKLVENFTSMEID